MSRRREISGMRGGRKDVLEYRIYNTNGSRNIKAEIAREKEKIKREQQQSS